MIRLIAKLPLMSTTEIEVSPLLLVRWLAEIIVTGWIKAPNFVQKFLMKSPSKNVAFSENNEMATIFSLKLYCRKGYRTDNTK